MEMTIFLEYVLREKSFVIKGITLGDYFSRGRTRELRLHLHFLFFSSLELFSGQLEYLRFLYSFYNTCWGDHQHHQQSKFFLICEGE